MIFFFFTVSLREYPTCSKPGCSSDVEQGCCWCDLRAEPWQISALADRRYDCMAQLGETTSFNIFNYRYARNSAIPVIVSSERSVSWKLPPMSYHKGYSNIPRISTVVYTRCSSDMQQPFIDSCGSFDVSRSIR